MLKTSNCFWTSTILLTEMNSAKTKNDATNRCKLDNIGTNNILNKYKHNKDTTNIYTETPPLSELSLKVAKTDFQDNGNIQQESKHHKRKKLLKTDSKSDQEHVNT